MKKNQDQRTSKNTDRETIPGLCLPVLTTSKLKHIKTYQSSTPLYHHLLSMMSHVTQFIQNHYKTYKYDKPFTNDRRNEMFGRKIASIIGHNDRCLVTKNCFEACSAGYKTQDKFGFDSHIDVLNSWKDVSYSYVTVMSQALQVPANPTIEFGGEKKLFSICYIQQILTRM